MFKLAVFTDEVSQDFGRVIEVANEFGLDGIEIRSVWDHAPQDISQSDIARMKSMLADTNLKVCSIAAPFFKCELDSQDEYKEHLDILRKCIALGKTFDCNIIRGFTFWRRGNVHNVWQRLLDKFQEPIKILESEDAFVGIENEFSTYIGTGRTLAKFLDGLDSSRVRAIWDPANVCFDTDDVETPFPEGYRAIRPYIIHVHVKDCQKHMQGNVEHTPVGKGDVGWKEQFEQLAKDGYEGYASLETHWRTSEQLTDGLVERPGGKEYSESAEAASRICLQNIKKMISS